MDDPVPVECWRDAVNRLDLMEERARSVLRAHGRMTSIQVARVIEPVIEPVTGRELLLGPDGKPIQ